jgi:hypothetical protein
MEHLPATYNSAMEQARKEKWNVLTPAVSMEGLSQFHQPVVEVVRLSPNKEDGDIYPASNSDDDQKGKVRLSGKGIEKLAMAACIVWNLEHSRRTDDRSDDNYVSWQAVGGLRKPDGMVVWMKAEYDLDLAVIQEEMEQQARARLQKAKASGKDWAKKKDPDDYVEYCINRDMPQKRKHKLKLAETGARNRVIRALLGLKNEYTAAELAKPFVLARIVLQPDYNDPAVKQAVLAAYLQSTMGVFGPTVATQAQPIDIPKNDCADPDAPPPENGGDPDPEPGTREAAVIDFQNAEKADQVKTLEELIGRKGYDYAGAFTAKKKPVISLDKLQPDTRLKYFQMLIDLPDKTPNPDDDIPF